MAHFAELDENNYVKRVVVIANDEIVDESGIEDEALGAQRCRDLFGPGRWVQTSYNAHPFKPNSFRGKYAGPGDYYDQELDRFV